MTGEITGLRCETTGPRGEITGLRGEMVGMEGRINKQIAKFSLPIILTGTGHGPGTSGAAPRTEWLLAGLGGVMLSG